MFKEEEQARALLVATGLMGRVSTATRRSLPARCCSFFWSVEAFECVFKEYLKKVASETQSQDLSPIYEEIPGGSRLASTI